jgi:hypothetical protein
MTETVNKYIYIIHVYVCVLSMLCLNDVIYNMCLSAVNCWSCYVLLHVKWGLKCLGMKCLDTPLIIEGWSVLLILGVKCLEGWSVFKIWGVKCLGVKCLATYISPNCTDTWSVEPHPSSPLNIKIWKYYLVQKLVLIFCSC